jgi:small subunit ribosomal protein S1
MVDNTDKPGTEASPAAPSSPQPNEATPAAVSSESQPTGSTTDSPAATSAAHDGSSTTAAPTGEPSAASGEASGSTASGGAEPGAAGEGTAQASEGTAQASEGEAGEEGDGTGADGEGKKKRRRRRKKGGEAGAEGAKAEGEGAAAGGEGEGAAPGGENKGRAERSKNRPAPPPRERPAFQVGEEVFGKVKTVNGHSIIVDIQFGKAEGIFDRSELASDDMVPEIGDRFPAQVLGDGSRGGFVVLTRNMLREEQTKTKVEQAFTDKAVVVGLVTGAIKGGLEVYVEGLRAFAPASHVDLRPGADLHYLVGQQLLFFVEQYAKRGRDVVLSRRTLLEEDAKKQRGSSLAKLAPGSVVKGIVRSVVEWGVFVAIPEADNIEGLVHNTEVSHDPRARTRDLLKVGDEISVKILKIDERGKLWLSKRSAESDPWDEFRARYAPGTRHKGKVTKIAPFGAFIELEPGLEGLAHVSDLSLKRVEDPNEIVKEGQELQVIVASFDPSTRKIGLHPVTPGSEDEPKQRVQPNKIIKVGIVSHETGGLVVRILGATGRSARGFVPAGQTGTPRGTDLRKSFPLNSVHDAKVLEVDPRRGEAKLSLKAVGEDTERAAYSEYRQSVAKVAKFGTFADLMKKS